MQAPGTVIQDDSQATLGLPQQHTATWTLNALALALSGCQDYCHAGIELRAMAVGVCSSECRLPARRSHSVTSQN